MKFEMCSANCSYRRGRFNRPGRPEREPGDDVEFMPRSVLDKWSSGREARPIPSDADHKLVANGLRVRWQMS